MRLPPSAIGLALHELATNAAGSRGLATRWRNTVDELDGARRTARATASVGDSAIWSSDSMAKRTVDGDVQLDYASSRPEWHLRRAAANVLEPATESQIHSGVTAITDIGFGSGAFPAGSSAPG